MNTVASQAVNISSVIVGVVPDSGPAVRSRLEEFSGVEVHAVTEEGRMIVTIESDGDQATVQTFEAIRQLPGVLSAAMVYHQFESDPDGEA